MSCANCGGDHSPTFRGYPEFQRAAQIQLVKMQGKLSYAETIRMVPKIKTPVNIISTKTTTDGPVEVQTESVGVQTEMKDSECQTESRITDVNMNFTKE